MSEIERPVSDEKRHLSELEALQRDFDQAKSEYEQTKDQAAALKKLTEKKVRALHEYIRALNAPLPLFDVWRQTPIDELGLSDGIAAILNEVGYDTVGKLADLTRSGGKLTDIPHIGENKASAIADALERFWAKRKADGEV